MKIILILSILILTSCAHITQNWYLTTEEVELGKQLAKKAGYAIYYSSSPERDYVIKKSIQHEPVNFADGARSALLYNYNWWTFDK